jgi:catechol 2,3-dioxygenase-like lactoylglutathione lyase family enzyme
MTDAAIEPMTFDHAGISVANLEVSQKFYGDVLGFTHVEDRFELPQFEIRGLVLTNPLGVRIELFERRGSRPNRVGHPAEDTIIQGWFQFALGVADAQATFDRVVKAGAKPLLTPRIAPDGRSIVAFVGDPDNNLVEFLQRPVD